MDYIGKICPYCKTKLNENDDVVVCSICEMPHHKDCWIENRACTTFGCMGTISGIDPMAIPEPEPVSAPGYAPRPMPNPVPAPVNNFCVNCGASLKPGQMFCTSCGSRINRI